MAPDDQPIEPFAQCLEPEDTSVAVPPRSPAGNGYVEVDEAGPDRTLNELAGRARPEFPAEAFAPIPEFVPGRPPDIDPEVAEQVFRPVESPAVRKRPEPDGSPWAGPSPGATPTSGAPAAGPLPEPGSVAVQVAGLTKRCYRCGGETRAVAGLLLALGSDADDEPAKVDGPRHRRPAASGRDRYRFVPLPAVADVLAEVLDAAWCRQHEIAPIRYREMDPEYRFTGDDAGLANGCARCDAMLKDQPIQDAFEEAIGPDLLYDDFVLGTVHLPESRLTPGDRAG